jgi:hypothetical protein
LQHSPCFALPHYWCVCTGDATNANCISFGLLWRTITLIINYVNNCTIFGLLWRTITLCNSSSEQTKDSTIVGVVDYECNSSSEQTKDFTIVGVVDYECNSSQEQPRFSQFSGCWLLIKTQLVIFKFFVCVHFKAY